MPRYPSESFPLINNPKETPIAGQMGQEEGETAVIVRTIKKLSIAELERIVQDQLEQAIREDPYVGKLYDHYEMIDSLMKRYQLRMNSLSDKVRVLSEMANVLAPNENNEGDKNQVQSFMDKQEVGLQTEPVEDLLFDVELSAMQSGRTSSQAVSPPAAINAPSGNLFCSPPSMESSGGRCSVIQRVVPDSPSPRLVIDLARQPSDDDEEDLRKSAFHHVPSTTRPAEPKVSNWTPPSMPPLVRWTNPKWNSAQASLVNRVERRKRRRTQEGADSPRVASRPAEMFHKWKIQKLDVVSTKSQPSTPPLIDLTAPTSHLQTELKHHCKDGPPPLVPILPEERRDLQYQGRPILKVSCSPEGIEVQWTMSSVNRVREITAYDLAVHSHPVGVSLPNAWHRIGRIKAMPLPMFCTIGMLKRGYQYNFRIAAIFNDAYKVYSDTASIVV